MQANQADLPELTRRTWPRRKTYIINPSFQWKYALTAGVVVFLASMAIGIILYGLLHQQARLRAMHPDTYAAEVGTLILTFGLAFAAVACGAVGFWSVRVTHRICGPLALLEGYLADLTAGRMPQLRNLRRKDEFKQLHQSFKTAMNVLAENKEMRITKLDDAADLATSLLAEVNGDAQKTTAALLAQIETLRAVESGAQHTATAPDNSQHSSLSADNEFCSQPSGQVGEQCHVSK